MPDNTESRVRRLAEALRAEGVSEAVAAQVLEGGEAIRHSSSPEVKVAWLAEAMRRMDALVDAPTRRAARERCACCLSGKRHKLSRGIAKEWPTLDSSPRLSSLHAATASGPRAMDGWLPGQGAAVVRK